MELRLLGPVEAEAAGQRVDLGRRQERLLLALLALSARRPVPTERLVDLLWDGDGPPSARSVLHTYVSRLRAALPGIRIIRSSTGYLLDIDPERVDAHRFRRLVERARAAADGSERLRLLREALALWRGPALADVGSARVSERLFGELEELRGWAREQRIETELALGRHEALVGELTDLVAQPPVVESLAGYLMVALYRCGRRADALEVYRRTRARLADELGLDPGPELRRIEKSILRADPALDGPRGAPDVVPVPRQLPPDLTLFVGRRAEINTVRAAIEAPQVRGVPTTVAIHGPGGAGKSALAIHVAHALADRFPDGQLYVDLHGTAGDLTPVHPADVMARFLRGLNVPDREIPADVDEAAGLYRSILASRRILVLLDNAVDAAQVRPLLAAGAGCAVMMTSRRWLSTLDSVMHLDVGRLSQAEAIELLDRVTDDRRVSADPELAAEIVTRCDHLPLAVRIAGARLAARRNLALRDLAARLRNDRHRLDELAQDDLAVRTCFDGGYRELATRDPEAATMFRRLGLLAVATVSTHVAAALVDRSVRPAAATLDRLVEARLVEPIAPRHYRMHDLLRLFAVERAAEETTGTREAALRRALSCYLIAARAVGSEYRPNSIGDSSHEFVVHFPEPVPITGPAGAMEWLDEEIANLIAAARQTAAEPGPLNPFAVHLDTAIGDLLVGLGRWRETEAVSGAAVAAAQQSGDRAAQAFALVSVGSAYVQSGRIPAGIATLERAVALSVADGDARGEANCQDHLGWAYFTAGDFLRARDCVARGLELRMRAGNVTGEAISHNNLADILIVLGQPSDALPHLEASVLIHRNNGDRVGAAIARSNVGRCLLLLGRNVEAVPVLDEAAEVFHESENVREEWRAILTRAVARRRTGAPELARRDCERALDLCRSAQDAYGEATCLDQLGIAVQHCGDDRLGTEHRRRAAALRAGTDISPDHSLEAVLAL